MERIKMCDDGKYRWAYELDMMKNPVIFNLIVKVMLLVFAIVWGVVLIIMLFEGDFSLESITMMGKVLFYVCVTILVIAALSYYIYTKMIGGYYCVIFEMDENGVNHMQMDKQVDINKAIGLITALVGAATKSIGAASAGLASYYHQDLYTDFSKVRNIIVLRQNNTIKLNQFLIHNQVYAEDEDFDFVLDYIIEHCPKARVSE